VALCERSQSRRNQSPTQGRSNVTTCNSRYWRELASEDAGSSMTINGKISKGAAKEMALMLDGDERY